MNNPDYFSKLDLTECKKIAHRWGKEYLFIKKVLLYAGHGASEYILMAEVGLNRAVNYTRFSKDWTSCSKRGGFCNPILWDNRNSTLGYKEQEKSRPETVIEFNDAKVRWEFKTQLNRFSERWLYVIKEPGISETKASLVDSYMLGEFSWVLYDSDAQVHEDAEDTKTITRDLIQKAKPEIEIIYSAMKREVGFSGHVLEPEIKLQQKAEEVFTKRKNNFKLIKSDYLKDQSIYILNPGQPKRDFVGRLLKRIVKDKTGKIFGGQTLYGLYAKLD